MIDKKYQWVLKEPGPKILLEGIKLYGVAEVPGPADNPVILNWAKELGGDVGRTYNDDLIPWCGLYVAIVAHRAGWEIPKTPLWARSWAAWGDDASDEPSLGDILVFSREGGGHVGIYIGEDKTHYHVLGGNQMNCVSIVRIAKKRCIAKRKPKWRVGPPANRRPIKMAASGPITTNEA